MSPGTTLINTMASRYEMEPQLFAKTIRATVMPSQHTDEEFRAFMMVAFEYGLNPITKEIYAYPKKGGGINPVVSIDGWVHLVNSHPQCDGFEITYVENPEGKGKPPVSATCTIWRKDRGHPIKITEYYAECVRSTEPWNTMPRRMLRHKALKEAARYAFGYSGIADDDEARDISGSVQQIQKPIIVDAKALDDFAASAAGGPEIDMETGEIVEILDAAQPDVEEKGGSSEPPHAPIPTAAAAPDRGEAIHKILQQAGDTALTVQQRLENLTNLQPIYEERYAKPFVKDLMQIGGRVAKGELSAERGKAFLERLP